MQQKEFLRKFYDESVKLVEKIAKEAELTSKDLERYYDPYNTEALVKRFGEGFKSLPKDDTRRLMAIMFMTLTEDCFAISKNTFKITENGRRKILCEILCGFEPRLVIDTYGKGALGANALYGAIYDSGKIEIEESREKRWRGLSRGLIDGAEFLSDPKNVQMITDNKNGDYKSAAPLWKALHKGPAKIKGIGAALAWNFIKDTGYYDVGKPDTQVIKIISGIGAWNDETDEITRARKAFAEIGSYNKDVDGFSIFKMDRIIWLICTGDFYLDDKKIGRHADEYREIIEKLKEPLATAPCAKYIVEKE